MLLRKNELPPGWARCEEREPEEETEEIQSQTSETELGSSFMPERYKRILGVEGDVEDSTKTQAAIALLELAESPVFLYIHDIARKKFREQAVSVAKSENPTQHMVKELYFWNKLEGFLVELAIELYRSGE